MLYNALIYNVLYFWYAIDTLKPKMN